jgi:Na+-transporting NADH:ubiquinone oxidoreductase subunit B
MKPIFKLLDYLVAESKKPESILRFQHQSIEALDVGLRRPPNLTKQAPHIRDATDLKRYMILVVVSLLPCLVWGIYITGRNAYLSIGAYDVTLMQAMVEGALHVLPLVILSYAVGGFWEAGIFCEIRGHEVAEGFLVTGMLYPLVVPATIPWWQFAIGISFGVVIGKEVFGGSGMNILNPALTARAFLFFAYPAQMSGDVWVVKPFHTDEKGVVLANLWTTIPTEKINAFIDGQVPAVDGYSGATALAVAAVDQPGVDSVKDLHDLWEPIDMVLGLVPGSIGETSLIAIGLGAILLIATGIGSWRTMLSTVVGALAMASILYFAAGPDSPTFFTLNPVEHLLIGGFAFGAVFMATDPVSSPAHKTSKLIYGFLIGVLCVLIRTVNPAYPEGMMLAILFMNVFAPLIDHYVIRGYHRRRKRSYAG